MTILASISNLGSMNTTMSSSKNIVSVQNNISSNSNQAASQNAGLIDLNIFATVLGLIGIKVWVKIYAQNRIAPKFLKLFYFCLKPNRYLNRIIIMIPPVNLDLMISNMKLLLDSKQYASSELLGNFIISLPIVQKSIPIQINVHSLFAESLFGKGEYIRALKYFKFSLDLSFKYYNVPSNANFNQQHKILENEIKYKISQCYLHSKRSSLALSYLESISFGSRNLETHLTLARIYKELGRNKESILAFKEVLKLCPLCLEAINSLKEMGEDIETVMTISLNKQTNSSVINSNPQNMIDLSWIPIYIQSQIEIKRNQPQKSLTLLKKIENKFNNNLLIYENMAITYLYHDEPSIINSFNYFQKIRQNDPYYIGSMDIYCSLLKRRSLQFELNKICHELISLNPQSPESWTSIALYYFLKENVDKSLEHVERAISINESHSFAHSLRGEILLSLDEPKEALPSLERAFQLSKNILTARELVRCHLILNQMPQALSVAKAIHSLSPEYSKSMALVGMVLANQPEEREEARKILSQALVLSPYCTDTVLTLSKLNVVEGRFQEAIDILRKQLDYQETDLMHTEIGNVYLSKEMFDEAMSHYNSALEINPQYEPASRGLHRLDLIMKGIDPDQTIEEEIQNDNENMDEDVEEEDEDEVIIEGNNSIVETGDYS
ncbi:hypothetical protein DLAC_11166 [Tieghemostelium lacteum]|uniref:Anaphase-promoting complex subunit 7 n=1 Tax=Tieghemostelium lacteum TaxID=361077 RepID=A0A151Z3D8_TIELA|nr:hypothetical protein DLAC_11166 [Tieghemostelium lacteum]|eukprot:KYQ88458.1 hypothetical protein DLAC_11166 [Tieghemostelium lacteum]